MSDVCDRVKGVAQGRREELLSTLEVQPTGMLTMPDWP